MGDLQHRWLFLSSHGEDAPNKSLDSYYQCAGCGAVKHDYAHGGGQTSPNYPMVYKYGVPIEREAPCLGLLGAARSSIDHRSIGAGGGDEDDGEQCRATHPDDGLRCVYGANHRVDYHGDGERRWRDTLSSGKAGSGE